MRDGRVEPELEDRRHDGAARIGNLRFAQRAAIAAAVAALVVLGLLLVWYGGHILLLAFASILAGAGFYGISRWISERTGLRFGWSLAAVVLALIALLALAGALFANSLAEQITQLQEQVPRAIQQVRQQIERLPFARSLMGQGQQGSGGGSGGALLQAIAGFFTATFNGVVNLVIVLIVGVYLAASPHLYTGGLLRLVPLRRRERAGEVLGAVGSTLRWWLIGRLAIMVVNGVLTGLGLWLLGMPFALVLGVLTGILNFIPNFGPILAAIPAVLVASTQGPQQLLFVVLLFAVIQNLEGFLLTPMVDKTTVSLPPAVEIFAEVLLGVLAGPIGILVASPLTASVMVVIRMLYVEDTLGDRRHESDGRRA